MAITPVQVQMDKVRTFKYGNKATSLVEQALNVKSAAKVITSEEEMSTQEFFTFMWAGLVHEDPQLTVDSVMDIMDEVEEPQKVIVAMFKSYFGNINGGDFEKKILEVLETGQPTPTEKPSESQSITAPSTT